jgi:REP element-mobilizing transposase RayT
VERKRKAKPPRLSHVFASYDAPLYFVTFNTYQRRPLLACRTVHAAFAEYSERTSAYHIAVGRYVIMPDHVHLFVPLGVAAETTLSDWIKGLKRHLDSAMIAAGHARLASTSRKPISFWQPGFHDHLLRHSESYAQKWNYLRENPVRAGLVTTADDWPFAGEIVLIDRV